MPYNQYTKYPNNQNPTGLPYGSKVPSQFSSSALQVSTRLLDILNHAGAAKRQIIVVCIGTDRSTGDALGPLVGSRLTKTLPDTFRVTGTLSQPVHATNLQDVLSEIETHYHRPYIIAVDASLGNSKDVGKVSVKQGPVKPGAGVNKKLPPVGDCHITGVVNVGGFLEYLVLQNTRLADVFRLSLIISRGITSAIKKTSHPQVVESTT